MRQLRPLMMVLALVALGVALGAPSAEGAGSAGVTATIAQQPAGPITAGEPVRYLTTLSDSGPSTFNHIELTLPLPAGMTAISASTSTGSCTTLPDEVDCSIGTLKAGESAQVSVIARTSQTGTFSVTAFWSGDNDQNDAHDFSATTSTTVSARTSDAVNGYVPPSGDTLTTDPGTGATTENPQVTTARVPATQDGTPASLAESNASGPSDGCGPAASCFGQISTITIAQTFTPGNPLRFTFVLDKSEVPTGIKVGKIPMFHDGVLVPSCTGAAGTASPDPCVVSRTTLKKSGDVQIVVLSSTNGRWRP
jgi:uncharacterized repeat protein (TIGR01451 family)